MIRPEDSDTNNWHSLRDILSELFPRDLSDKPSPTFSSSFTPTSIPTGFSDVDQLLGGLNRSDLVILAARPSIGKSSLALNIAHNVAKMGAVVFIRTLENNAQQLFYRLLASETGIDSHRMRLGLMGQDEERRLIDAVGHLSDLKVFVDDTPSLSIIGLRSRARRLQFMHGLDLLIVDYLQLLQGTTGRSDNRVQEISEISRSLKTLARELNVPVLACSQLSRAVEMRPNHRPQLSDLRDSGSIEQDADVVMFIHREDRYVSREEWELRNPEQPYPENLAEIMVAKHRNGPTGNLMLHFNGSLARFED
jgi:replicative DNA helicase